MRTISLFIIVIATILSSCKAVYVPNKINAPLLKEKGDLCFDGSVGNSGFDIQGAFGVTDNVGIMVNTSSLDYDDTQDTDSHEHLFGEFGLAYFNKISENVIYEIWGGYGFGKINSREDAAELIKGNAQRYFIQPNIGVKLFNIFDLALSTRFCYFNYKPEITSFSSLKNVYVEPAITARLGFKNIKLSGQLGLSFLAEDELKFSSESQALILNFGIHIYFSELFKKEETKNLK